MTTMYYAGETVSDFEALVFKGFDLASPFRSTIPLLAYWSEYATRLDEFLRTLGLPSLSINTSLTFEFPLKPKRGRGHSSQTDLMVLGERSAIATEAKYTEGPYETVASWLGTLPSKNKQLVLEGWLELINQATETRVTSEQVRDCTYQLLHRTASACYSEADRRLVVYHCFDPTHDMLMYYSSQLKALRDLLGEGNGRLSFYLYVTIMSKTCVYAELQSEWLSRGKPDLSDKVRELLVTRRAAGFSTPVVWRF